MAFVYKSEREISPEINTATGDIGPGQYLPQSFTKIPKQTNAGFNSKTYRNQKIIKDDNPGPGSYTYDDKYEKFISYYNEKKNNSPTILESLEYAKPENLDPFTIIINRERSNNVAFLSKEKRFKENSIGELPGPGEYNKHEQLLIVKNSLKQKKQKKIPNKSRKDHSLIRYDKPPTSPFRLSTIPSKNFCYGFDIGPMGDLYVKDDPEKDYRHKGIMNDSVGPGSYDLNKHNEWNKNAVKWEKQSQSNRNNLYNSQELPKNKLLESNYNNKLEYFKTSLDKANNLISNKNEIILSSQKTKFEKEKYMKHVRERRQRLYDMKTLNSGAEDELLNKHVYKQDPGPGYYFSEISNSAFKPTRVLEKFQSFGSNSLRFSENFENEEVGPGAYFNDDNKMSMFKLKKFLNEKNNFAKNSINQREEIIKERQEKHEERMGINGIINQHKLSNYEGTPGPGNYDLNGDINKKFYSNLSQFGSLQKRFQNNSSNYTPGPGSYVGAPKLVSNIIKIPMRPKKLLKKEEQIRPDESIFPKEEVEEKNPPVPGVGSYNPDIVHSMGYKIAKNINKFNKSSAPFNVVERRFTSNVKKTAAENIGPGQYYKDKTEKVILMNLLNNSPPFNTGAEKNSNNVNKNNSESGPGSYDLGSYFDWNKKSYNVQFV